MSIQSENLIKESILDFMESELIAKVNSYIPTLDLINELIIFLSDKKINKKKNQIKIYIIPLLSQHFGFQDYKSLFFKGKRVYFDIAWKYKDSFTTLDTIVLKNEVIDLRVELNEIRNLQLNELNDFKLKLNEMNLQLDKIKDKSLEIKKINNTNNTLDIDNNLEIFIDRFIEYSKDSNTILYLQDILENFKNYTSLNISNDKFSKDFKKIIFIKYPEIEAKRHNNKKYYKGLIYKTNV
jgi:hypothetical protein